MADVQLKRSHAIESHAAMVMRSGNQVISAKIVEKTTLILQEKRPERLIKPLAGTLASETTSKQYVDSKEKGKAKTNAVRQ